MKVNVKISSCVLTGPQCADSARMNTIVTFTRRPASLTDCPVVPDSGDFPSFFTFSLCMRWLQKQVNMSYLRRSGTHLLVVDPSVGVLSNKGHVFFLLSPFLLLRKVSSQ